MDKCNYFTCQCGRLYHEKKISRKTYYGMLLGYAFAHFQEDTKILRILKRFGFKSTHLADEETIGGELAAIEVDAEFFGYFLNEVRRKYKIFDELAAKALGEKK